MAAPQRQPELAPAEPQAPAPRPGAAGGRPAARKRRTRLRRGPLTIGEPSARIDPRLASAEPYRPDTIADGGEAFGLTVRAASVRGLYKRYVGGPRQDDLCLRVHEPTQTLIVAVADGVSGAPRSDLGAALAVRHAIAAVARQLDADQRGLEWGEVFDQAAWALVEQQRRDSAEADAGVEAAAAALATTLVVATLCEREVRAAAVGDSPAFLLSGGEFELVVGDTQSGDELAGGVVRSLPRHPRPVDSATCTLGPQSVLLLCSDGLALPLGDGRGEVGWTFARELRRPPDIVDFARLLDFSRSTYDDDRTLVAVWPERKR